MGVTRLRLARFGSRNRPFYRVVAIDSRKFRDDAPIEYVRVARGAPEAGQCCEGGGRRRLLQGAAHAPPPPPSQLGTYDPLPYGLDAAKEVRLAVDRVKYWLSVGAQPSERVAYLLWRAGLAPAPPVRFSPSRSKPKEKKAAFHSASEAWLAAGAAAGAAAAAAPRRAAPPAALAFGLFSRGGGALMR